MKNSEKAFFVENFASKYSENFALGERSYIRLGGVAKHFIKIEDQKDMEAFEKSLVPRFDYAVVGKMSNTLVADNGIDFPVVMPSFKADADSLTGFAKEKATFHAGIPLARAVRMAQENNLKGLEFALGIPGSVGGGVCMNAGADGNEMKDVLESVLLFRGKAFQWVPARELDLSYRSSNIAKSDLVMAAKFRLEKVDQAQRMLLKKQCLINLTNRKKKQPLGLPSLGSTFKNPKNDFAARLLQKVGLKGVSVGGVSVSKLHANFIVNDGTGTAKQAGALIEKMKATVLTKTGVQLHTEIRFLGNF